jgi:hypothetical protein
MNRNAIARRLTTPTAMSSSTQSGPSDNAGTATITRNEIQAAPGYPVPLARCGASSGNASPTDSSPLPEPSPLYTQLGTVIAGIGCNQHTSALLLDAWGNLGAFLEQSGTLPERLEQIGPQELAQFSAHCRSTATDVDALHTMFGMLRQLLVHAGLHWPSVAALTAPAVRSRVANSPNGKYVIKRRLVEPAPSDQVAANATNKA